MKLLKNTYTQCVCFAGLVLLIGGCAASSTAPVTAKSTGTTYECEAGDTSWECRAQATESGVQPTLTSSTADVGEPEPVSEPTRTNSSWWSIRSRSGETTNRASRNETRVATTERRQRRAVAQAEEPKQEPRTVAKTDAPKRERRGFFNIRRRGGDSSAATKQESETVETKPAQVVETSPVAESTRTTSPSRPLVSMSTRPSETLSTRPTDSPSRQTASQRPSNVSANPAAAVSQPVAVVQVPLPNSRQTSTARRVASTANPDVPLDGLGGDYDYAVQLAAFTNYGLSSDFLSSYPSLDLMRVKTQSKGKTFYIVLAGTFESKQLASAQSQMLTSTYGIDEPYIRTVRSIRDVQIN